MLELSKGSDILAVVGGISSLAEAQNVLSDNLDEANLKKLSVITNADALIKIANAIVHCKPDTVFVNSGSTEDLDWIRHYSLDKGEERKLAKDGHTIHFDLPQDQARLVNQTFYIINEGEKMSSLAKSILRDEGTDYVRTYMDSIMKGLTMMIGFYSRGPAGAEASIPAIEISSSTYVFHSAELLYRNCYDKFDSEADRVGVFFTNVHSEGANRPEAASTMQLTTRLVNTSPSICSSLE
jgi:phosphoenolpyruvate carboxykinase (GTP)